jgi:hypothetical protein
MRLLSRVIGILGAALLLTLGFAATAGAKHHPPASPSVFFSQGFETDTSGWCNDPLAPCDGISIGTINRVPSGYTNGGGYADGIASAAGNWHARLRLPSDPNCQPGVDNHSFNCSGPYSEFPPGGMSGTFPEPGYVTQLDVYLDTGFAATHNDYRFDLESAINDTSGSYLQGFDFNAGTLTVTPGAGPPGFAINASTNAGRGGAFPENTCPNPPSPAPFAPCRLPVYVTTSGWYTFRHTFTDVSGAVLVRMQIFDSTGATVADWTIQASAPTSDTGGPTLLWFPNQEINDLAIDNELLRSLQPQTKEDCKDGRWRMYTNPSFKNQGQCIKFVDHGG